jgi:hypothetical protein
MSRVAVDELVYLLGDAFAGTGIEESGESQALMTNLATVDERQWREVPAGGSRSIESIVLHVGSCKVMYDDYAFGAGTLTWEDSEVQPWPTGTAPLPDALEWLRRVHDRLVDHIGALDDAELGSPRRTNWGDERETRWIVAAMVGHDLYHAGEINHIRSLFAGEDRWMWQRWDEMQSEGGR